MGLLPPIITGVGLVLVYLLIVTQTMTAQESAPGSSDGNSVGTQGSSNSYLPAVFRPVPAIVLNEIGRPTSTNHWSLSWSSGGNNVLHYEVQEAHDANFTVGVTSYNSGNNPSIPFNHPPSLDNVYYYRVRAVYSQGNGQWSNIRSVRGGWRDDFDDPTSGWAMRRTTYLEYIIGYYQEGNLIIIVDDRWDWTIWSPLVPAPEPPYAIEYVARIHDASNLVSHGAVYGGDWNGQPCPDYSSFDGIYKHHICFNEFYNNNFIWYGPLKMVFERVDFLYWCADVPKCDGDPPLKRALGYSYERPVLDKDPGDWHTWRIEVRQTGIKLFVDGFEFSSNNDNMFVNNPYFGLFASTNEYKPSILITDSYQVTYLDQ